MQGYGETDAVGGSGVMTGPDAPRSLALGPGAEAAGQARRFVREVLDGSPPDLVADTELVVSELVTNATLHGEPPIVLRIEGRPDGVHVEVEDAGPAMPIFMQPHRDNMTGRGLSLILGLSVAWGVDRLSSGKTVWAELAAESVAPVRSRADRPGPAEMLADWNDDSWSDALRHTVRIGQVPTALLIEAKAHIDNVVREMSLLRAAASAGGTQPPPEVAQLVQTVTEDFAEARAEIKRQAVTAAARGEALTDLVLHLPFESAAAGERYLDALDQADRYARSARMLTLAPPRSHRVFRQWYVESIVGQIRDLAAGRPARRPEPLAALLAGEVDRLAGLQDDSDRLAVLSGLAVSLGAAGDGPAMAEAFVDSVFGYLGIDSVRVLLATARSTMCLVASRPSLPDLSPGLRDFSIEEDLPVAEAARTGKPLVVRTARKMFDRYPVVAPMLLDDHVLHILPVVADRRVVAVVTLGLFGTRIDEDGYAAFVNALVALFSQALRRAETIP
jgi:anti-sigma regulatory factor (Ser/Thr protein kinase)